MKRLLLALLIGSATLTSFSSCTKEYVTPVSKTMVYERTANQWKANSSKDKYVDLDVPELSNYYVDQGVVTLAMSFDNEQTYNALPATIDGVSYNYDYTTGSVRIYAQDPIFENGTTINVPNHVFVKVTLTEADFVQ
ncbi:hypothetical protein LZQ00_01965 [Sphingobacterium sp. SRCM116780]|uniref:hypothetical protein n=1 Tax=Sphingobacterium sp. SRCM116780 TaxID=2907623 RepID=UPI001F48D94C|nr:hypothetical protein [Sphingobacterium sp. SRCM116780]UIR56600.1 hypothetical protein LZQ00_01965 [Sphingobacterium sp. SRCM116780]